MAHQNKTVNLLIQDSNGQQQILQVMQTATTGKPLTQASVKNIVKEVTGQETSSIIGGQNFTSPIMQKFAVGQKFITMQNNQRVVNSQTTKTGANGKTMIRFSQSQLGQLKIIHPPSGGHSITTKTMDATALATASSSSSTSAPVPVTVVTPKPVTSPFNYNKKTPAVQSQIHTPASRRRKTDKVGRGLRHFSMKVCEKVREKGTTSYNEVADELVAEETEGNPSIDPASYDQKNIRRRVYDALNVLMAMNIISKEKKEIRWHGLPTNTLQECDELEKDNEKRRERIELKQQQLRELILQHVAFKSLVARNKDNEERNLIPTPSSAIQLPFIIVNTDKKTHINCSISNDKSEYSFKFDDTFEIHDDLEVLKRMGLLLGLDKGECTSADILRIKSMVPKVLEKYIDAYGLGQEEDLDVLTYNPMYGDDSMMSTFDRSDVMSMQDNSEANEDDMGSDDGRDG